MNRNRIYRATLYSVHYIKALKSYQETNERRHLCQAVYYGIKSFAHERDVKPANVCNSQFVFDDLAIRYNNMSQLIEFTQRLTPNELLKLFPVKKFYNGKKCGVKDYFYTMGTLQRHGLDTPIGREVYSMLYDYTNIEVSLFLVKLFSTITQLDTMRC